jgi:hypothetical protein
MEHYAYTTWMNKTNQWITQKKKSRYCNGRDIVMNLSFKHAKENTTFLKIEKNTIKWPIWSINVGWSIYPLSNSQTEFNIYIRKYHKAINVE